METYGKIVKLLEDEVADAANKIDGLADSLRDRLDKREVAARALQDAQQAVPPLRAEIENLMHEHQEASFAEDPVTLKRISSKRKDLAKRVQAAEKAVVRKRRDFESVDFDTRSAGLEAKYRAMDIRSPVERAIDKVDGTLWDMKRELAASHERVLEQFARCDQEPDEDRDVEVLEKVRPGTKAEREDGLRRWRDAFRPLSARF